MPNVIDRHEVQPKDEAKNDAGLGRVLEAPSESRRGHQVLASHS